jgi:hypothetical protein
VIVDPFVFENQKNSWIFDERLAVIDAIEFGLSRGKEGRSNATVNRQLSILRTAFHNARKRTPPKVLVPGGMAGKKSSVRIL